MKISKHMIPKFEAWTLIPAYSEVLLILSRDYAQKTGTYMVFPDYHSAFEYMHEMSLQQLPHRHKTCTYCLNEKALAEIEADKLRKESGES